jgi:hypothetical protein
MEVKKNNPFKYINTLCEHKWLKVDKREYVPFLVNRFFSYFPDTVLIAEQGARISHKLSEQAHYDYYYGLVKGKKRFVPKWHKSKVEDIVSSLVEYYDISEREARLISSTFSDDDLKTIRKELSERVKYV